MSAQAGSRDRVLQRIRNANARVGEPPQAIQRDYDRISTKDSAGVLALFEERLCNYDARVLPVRQDEIAAKAAELLQTGNKKRIVVPAGLPVAWRSSEVEWIEDHDLSFEALNAVDGVMTAATLGVAISGSIVLQHGAAEGRRVLTLLPDYHLCVVQASQIVETLPEAFARLDPTRPVTFFSGPSATADIEMTRIKGVHGPRFLDVLLVVA